MADRISQAIAQAIAWCSTRPGSVISTVLAAAVAVWLALPALFIPYSEGFQPQVVRNAHASRWATPASATCFTRSTGGSSC